MKAFEKLEEKLKSMKKMNQDKRMELETIKEINENINTSNKEYIEKYFKYYYLCAFINQNHKFKKLFTFY